MAVTTLDRKSALVVIDLLKGIVAYPTVHPASEVVRHAGELADAFRRHGLPVVLVTVAGLPAGRTEQSWSAANRSSDWADLLPELNQQPGDHVARLGESGTTREIIDLLDRTRA